jgi:hypothetical protein
MKSKMTSWYDGGIIRDSSSDRTEETNKVEVPSGTYLTWSGK